MVASGKLPVTEAAQTNDLQQIVSILTEKLSKENISNNLSEKSIELLVKAYYYDTSAIETKNNEDYCYIKIGSEMMFLKIDEYQVYLNEIIALLKNGLLQDKHHNLCITEKGKAYVGKLIGDMPTYTQVKVKCLNCGLHFIICTWDKDRHTNQTIHCPECGSHNGAHLVWIQEKPGFIFEDVPGNAMLSK